MNRLRLLFFTGTQLFGVDSGFANGGDAIRLRFKGKGGN